MQTETDLAEFAHALAELMRRELACEERVRRLRAEEAQLRRRIALLVDGIKLERLRTSQNQRFN